MSDNIMQDCLVQFRRDLRQLLFEHGVFSNPGWSEEDIVDAFRQLLISKNKQIEQQIKNAEAARYASQCGLIEGNGGMDTP